MKRRKNKNKQLLRLASKFQPWDFGYMLEIEKQMLRQMQEYHEHSNIIEDNPVIARQIKWAIKLLNIADETESAWRCSGAMFGPDADKKPYKSWITTYVNTRNWRRFFNIPDHVNTDWSKCHVQDHLRQQKAWYIYNKLRYYYLQTFWD